MPALAVPRALTQEVDVEARSMLAFTLGLGGQFLAAEHGERSRDEVTDLAVDRLLA